MNNRTLYKLERSLLILIFCLSIYAPFVTGIIQEDKISSGIEKRNLAKLPPLPESLTAFNKYPEELSTYYSDHFGFREELTRRYFKLVNMFCRTKTSVDDVTVGKDGWLFLGSIRRGYQRYDDPIGDAINVNLFTEHELNVFAESIMTIKNWLNSKGIEYIYVIAPNKHTIYFENLPEYISKQNDKSSTDQLVAYLQDHTDVIVVDLRKSLFDEKKKHQIYFKTDTHWNQYGANVAQFEIMKRIKPLFPGQVTPFLLEDNQFKLLSREGGDLAELAKIENIKEDDPQPIFDGMCTPVNEQPAIEWTKPHTLVCEAKELNAVIFRDSFFTALQPYISRQFHRSTYLKETINYPLLIKYIEQEKPDIIIEEVVERMLPYVPSSALFDNAH